MLAAACLLSAVGTLSAQQIRNHYVSKAEADGVIYHTFPCTLFEHREQGALTFDITYKEHRDGRATINFTYEAERVSPADSVRFVSGTTSMSGPVEKIYLEPDHKRWRHRYSFRAPVERVAAFFDEEVRPTVTLYVAGRETTYEVKRSAWRSYAPVAYRIFEMIRVNEATGAREKVAGER